MHAWGSACAAVGQPPAARPDPPANSSRRWACCWLRARRVRIPGTGWRVHARRGGMPLLRLHCPLEVLRGATFRPHCALELVGGVLGGILGRHSIQAPLFSGRPAGGGGGGQSHGLGKPCIFQAPLEGCVRMHMHGMRGARPPSKCAFDGQPRAGGWGALNHPPSLTQARLAAAYSCPSVPCILIPHIKVLLINHGFGCAAWHFACVGVCVALAAAPTGCAHALWGHLAAAVRQQQHCCGKALLLAVRLPFVFRVCTGGLMAALLFHSRVENRGGLRAGLVQATCMCAPIYRACTVALHLNVDSIEFAYYSYIPRHTLRACTPPACRQQLCMFGEPRWQPCNGATALLLQRMPLFLKHVHCA